MREYKYRVFNLMLNIIFRVGVNDFLEKLRFAPIETVWKLRLVLQPTFAIVKFDFVDFTYKPM